MSSGAESHMNIDEFNKHILAMQTQIETRAAQDEDETPEFYAEYMRAQLLCSCGMYREALPHLESGWSESKSFRDDFVWESICVNLGSLLASTLDYLGEVEKAQTVYEDLLRTNPTGPFIGEYAVFLHRRKRNFEMAESFYIKALEVYPTQSSIHLKYAGFLRHVKRDISKAEQHYKLAVETNPLHADALGSYASFLHGVSGKVDVAEQYYEEAVKLDDTHANNLCNFGLFLSEEKKAYDRAEKYYRRALEATPRHANTLYNFAVMLDTHCKRKVEAEGLYKRCLEVEPRHSFALYNLAVLLEEKYTQKWEQQQHLQATDNASIQQGEPAETVQLREEVGSLYRRAVEADSKDSTALADCGRFLYTKMDDAKAGEPYLENALSVDHNNEVALYNLGLLKHRKKGDLATAERHLRHLLTVVHKHSAGMQQLARVLVDQFSITFKPSGGSNQTDAASSTDQKTKLDEAMELFEKAFSLQKDPGNCAVEYIKVVMKLGSNKQKLRAIGQIDANLKKWTSSSAGLSREKDLRDLLNKITLATPPS